MMTPGELGIQAAKKDAADEPKIVCLYRSGRTIFVWSDDPGTVHADGSTIGQPIITDIYQADVELKVEVYDYGRVYVHGLVDNLEQVGRFLGLIQAAKDLMQ